MSKPDDLSIAMQNEAIKISEQRLGRSLPPALVANIQKPWSYMGLEMIIDTVRTIEIESLESYLTKLDQ